MSQAGLRVCSELSCDGALRVTAGIANRVPATRFGKRETLCGHFDRLAHTMRIIFPVKTAPNMAAATGLSVRACEYFLSRRTGLSSAAVVGLLRTEHGLAILEALMGDARPAWWKKLKRSARREIVQREIEDLERELKGIDDDYAAQAPPARRHQTVRALGQAGARKGKLANS